MYLEDIYDYICFVFVLGVHPFLTHFMQRSDDFLTDLYRAVHTE